MVPLCSPSSVLRFLSVASLCTCWLLPLRPLPYPPLLWVLLSLSLLEMCLIFVLLIVDCVCRQRSKEGGRECHCWVLYGRRAENVTHSTRLSKWRTVTLFGVYFFVKEIKEGKNDCLKFYFCIFVFKMIIWNILKIKNQNNLYIFSINLFFN